MSQRDMTQAIKRYGPWAGVRYLRNQEVPFEQTYMAVFGRPPRL